MPHNRAKRTQFTSLVHVVVAVFSDNTRIKQHSLLLENKAPVVQYLQGSAPFTHGSQSITGMTFQAPLVVFTIHTCGYVLEGDRNASFTHGLDGPVRGARPADGVGKATLVDARLHSASGLGRAPILLNRFELPATLEKWSFVGKQKKLN